MEIETNTTIVSQKFRDKRNGEIVTQFSIMDIEHFEKYPKVEQLPKPKKPKNNDKFSAFIQYQIDLDKWKRQR